MICPVCRKDALIVEYNSIELDYCPNCSGVWFDSGELELLLESAGIKDFQAYLRQAVAGGEAAVTEKKRKCPICRRKMRKTYLGEGAKVLVDVCASNHGIWFDGGEVVQLAKALESQTADKTAFKDVLVHVAELFQYRKPAQ
jgi:uncharacterized protein